MTDGDSVRWAAARPDAGQHLCPATLAATPGVASVSNGHSSSFVLRSVTPKHRDQTTGEGGRSGRHKPE